MDGSGAISPAALNITIERGISPIPGGATVSSRADLLAVDVFTPTYSAGYTHYVGVTASGSAANQSDQLFRRQYLLQEQSPVEDLTDAPASSPTAVSLSEFTDTPNSILANISTIEATVTPPGDPNYSHAAVYYKLSADSDWTLIDQPAAPTTTVTVVSDGSTYDFKAVGVSTDNIENEAGATSSITTPNIETPDETEPASAPVVIPNVSGLQLLGQPIDTEFGGRDAQFVWRESSITQLTGLGQDPDGLGGDSGTLDLYFKDYRVEIYDGSTLLRTDHTTSPNYDYTKEKNAEDYLKQNGVEGAYRTFKASVVVRVTFSSAVSPRAAVLTVSNTLPRSITGLSVVEGFNSANVSHNMPDDRDYDRTLAYVGTSSGFALNASSLVFEDKATDFQIPGLNSDTEYFLVLEVRDEFGGAGTFSSEIAFWTLAGIDSSEVAGLGAWATQIPPVNSAFLTTYMESGSIITALLAGDSVTTDKLAALAVTAAELASSSVTSTKIANLAVGTAAIANLAVTDAKIGTMTVAKLTSATVTAKMVLSTVFQASTAVGAVINGDGLGLINGDKRAEFGPITDGGSGIVYILRAHNGYDDDHPAYLSEFHITADGSANFGGKLSAATGTFAGSLSAATGSFSGTLSAGDIKGSTIEGTSFTTTGSFLISPVSASDTTIDVKDTSDFASSGSGWILDATNDRDAFSWTGKTAATLTGCSGVLAHGTGAIVIPKSKQMLISEDLNEMRFFGDRGDATIEELATIGVKTIGSDNTVGAFGTLNSSLAGLMTFSDSSYGIYAQSNTSAAVRAISSTGIGVDSVSTSIAVRGTNTALAFGLAILGKCNNGVAIRGESLNEYGGEFQGGTSPLRLTASISGAAPLHTANKGSLWVTSGGVLYINTNGLTTWQKVGAQ